jgi:ferredoxin--NADP+ reductase
MSDASAQTPDTTHAASEIPLPEVKMHVYKPTDPVPVKIVKSEICTSRKAAGFVRHVEFDVSGTQLVGQCVPGQSIGIIPPGADEKGRPNKVRLYSLASPTNGEGGNPAILSTTVKRTIDEHWETHRLFLGVASNYLCDLQVGETVMMSGPNGKRFILPQDKGAHDYMFFATGTGIAPFRGMIIDLLESGVKSHVTLLMGSPYATDLLYHDFFLKMQETYPNFEYITAISRERQADGHDPMYIQDRLRTDRDRLLPKLSSGRTLIYVCGLAGMELGIFQQLAFNLTGSSLEQYLQVDKATLADIRSWNRQMVHRQIKATKRVFLEVYA